MFKYISKFPLNRSRFLVSSNSIPRNSSSSPSFPSFLHTCPRNLGGPCGVKPPPAPPGSLQDKAPLVRHVVIDPEVGFLVLLLTGLVGVASYMMYIRGGVYAETKIE